MPHDAVANAMHLETTRSNLRGQMLGSIGAEEAGDLVQITFKHSVDLSFAWGGIRQSSWDLTADDKGDVRRQRHWAKRQPPPTMKKGQAETQVSRGPLAQCRTAIRAEELILAKRVARL